ncbi:MAG: TlpA family protein disulfide reductase [Bacteroidales bacterium]|nr:TlpA family protein disulfide reductase [Bacteroidales bacterium]
MKALFQKIPGAILMVIILVSCAQKGEPGVRKVHFEEIEPLFSTKGDTVYVINFWATWCKPCVAELPHFTELENLFRSRPVRVVLVSLDFPDRHESDLLPFIRDHKFRTEVIHLIDTDANRWIDKVNPSWSGAIPATLVQRNGESEFHEGSLSYEKLQSIVEQKLAES